MNIPALVRERYKIWSRFLTEQVGFSLQHSQQHTKEHCARVLLFCLLFAQRENLSEQDADALAMAACFHDSRRINDGLDIGHGHRAAKYYCTWCAEHEYVLDARVVFIMAYHEQNDKLGKAALQRGFSDDPTPALGRCCNDPVDTPSGRSSAQLKSPPSPLSCGTATIMWSL